MTRYIIYRHGSNAANQSMTQTMVLGSIDAASKKDAIGQAAARYTCYVNQRFEAKPISRCSKADQQWAFESDAMAS